MKVGQYSTPNAHLRLVRTGSTVNAYVSADRATWTAAGSCSINMAANIYIGLAVASGNTSSVNTSTFAQVQVVP